MTIDVQIWVVSGTFTLLSLVAAWQAWRLKKIYRSGSSWIGMITFILLGGQRLYGLFRLQANIEKSRAIIEEAKAKGVNMRGVNLDRLSPEQWLGVAWSFAIIFGFIVWQHWQHRDFEKNFGI